MASADSLEAMMTHIHTMEEAMVSVLVEALMKQSALIDGNILIVVDGPRGRKWAGRHHLRHAYLDGTLASIRDETEIVIEDASADTSMTKGADASGESVDLMESYSEEVEEEEGETAARMSSTQNPNLPSLPKLLPRPNLVLNTGNPQNAGSSSSSSADNSRKRHTSLSSTDNLLSLTFGGGGNAASSSLAALKQKRSRVLDGVGKEGTPPSKRRSLVNAFAVSENGGNYDENDEVTEDGIRGFDDDDVAVKEETQFLDSNMDDEEDDDEPRRLIINGEDGVPAATVVDGKTIYLIQDIKDSKLDDGRGRKDFIIKMPTSANETALSRPKPSTALRAIRPATGHGGGGEGGRGGSEEKAPKISTALAVTKLPPKEKPARRSPPSSQDKMVLNQTDIDVLRLEFDSPGGLDSLQDLLNYLQTISIQENPVVKPHSNAESLALEPYTWNRIHFSTIDEWMSVIRIMRTMGPAHLFANRDSLTYKLFSAIMRQFSRAVAHDCPYLEEKGDNVNRFLAENFDKFMNTFPNFNSELNANTIYDPRLRRNASSFRGIARKEVQKHYNEHLRNKMSGKLKATSHVLIPVENFWDEREEIVSYNSFSLYDDGE